MRASFTVFYEGPFWVGILESEDEGSLVVARHVFGAEPSNAELLGFMLDRFAAMPRSSQALSPAESAALPKQGLRSAKRAIREARKDAARGASTKAQAALKASFEESALGARACHRAEAAEDEERRRQLRELKRHEKHRGH
jgi:hypothetical protein